MAERARPRLLQPQLPQAWAGGLLEGAAVSARRWRPWLDGAAVLVLDRAAPAERDIGTWLRREGCVVVRAHSTREALEYIARPMPRVDVLVANVDSNCDGLSQVLECVLQLRRYLGVLLILGAPAAPSEVCEGVFQLLADPRRLVPSPAASLAAEPAKPN